MRNPCSSSRREGCRAPALRAPWLAALLGAALLVGSGPAPAHADDDSDEPARRVRFDVQSAREVPNDWITAVVGVAAEDADPTRLAEQVNREMSWALEQARAEPRVTAKTGGYQTHPVYEDGRLRRWRASQTLLLESPGADSDAMTALLGRLQSRIQLQSFDFSVAPETRERIEAELVSSALAAFTERAEQVRKSLGASTWILDEVSLGTGGSQPLYRERMAMAQDAMASPPPPAVEAGTSRVTVSASGSIVLE